MFILYSTESFGECFNITPPWILGKPMLTADVSEAHLVFSDAHWLTENELFIHVIFKSVQFGKEELKRI